MWEGALQILWSSGLYVSTGSRVSGGHVCLFTFYSFVPCYCDNCWKIAFIYNYLVWNVSFEVTAIKRNTGRGIKGTISRRYCSCFYRQEFRFMTDAGRNVRLFNFFLSVKLVFFHLLTKERLDPCNQLKNEQLQTDNYNCQISQIFLFCEHFLTP